MKNVFCLLFILIAFLPYVCFTQDRIPADESEWIRIESPSKDFSVAFPSNHIVNNEDGIYRIYAYENGTQLQVTMEEKKNAKKDFKRSLAYLKDRAEKYEFFTGGDFFGMQYNGKDNVNGEFYKSLNLASSNGVYSVSVYSKNLKATEYSRFLYSLRLDGQSLYNQKTEFPIEQQSVSISSLKTDEVVLKALKQEDGSQSFFEKTTSEDKETINDTANYSRGLIILKKPRANYTDSARQDRVQGTAKLKVTFFADGKVGAIKLIKSLSRDLDRESFKAARKIKFLPAEVDGKSVDTVRFIEYGFTIY